MSDVNQAAAALAIFGSPELVLRSLRRAGITRVVPYDFAAEMVNARAADLTAEVVRGIRTQRALALGAGQLPTGTALFDSSRNPSAAVIATTRKAALQLTQSHSGLASQRYLLQRAPNAEECEQVEHSTLGARFLGQIEASELYTSPDGCQSAAAVTATRMQQTRPGVTAAPVATPDLPSTQIGPVPTPRLPGIEIQPVPTPKLPGIQIGQLPEIPEPPSLAITPDITVNAPPVPLIDPNTDEVVDAETPLECAVPADCKGRNKRSEGKYFTYYEDPPGKTVARTYVRVDYHYLKGQPTCVLYPDETSWGDYWLSETGWYKDYDSQAFSSPRSCEKLTASRYVHFQNDTFCATTSHVYFANTVLTGKNDGELKGTHKSRDKGKACVLMLRHNIRLVRTRPYKRCTGDDCEKYDDAAARRASTR